MASSRAVDFDLPPELMFQFGNPKPRKPEKSEKPQFFLKSSGLMVFIMSGIEGARFCKCMESLAQQLKVRVLRGFQA